MQSHIHRMHVCLAGTCHLHFWQNDQDLLCATVETQGWNRYQKKWVSLESWHWKENSSCAGDYRYSNGCLDSISNRSLGHCAGDYRYSNIWLNSTWNRDHWVIVLVITGTLVDDSTVEVITGTPMDDSTQLETEITGYCAGDYWYSSGWLSSAWNRDPWVIVQVITGTPIGDSTWNRDHWIIVQVITGTPMGDLTQLKTEITGSLCRWLQVLQWVTWLNSKQRSLGHCAGDYRYSGAAGITQWLEHQTCD